MIRESFRRNASFRRVIAVLMVLAFVLRLFNALALAPPPKGLDDDSFFHAAANTLADGRGYVQPLDLGFFHRTRSTAEHVPVYPFSLSVIARAGGRSFDAQRVLNVVAGTLLVLVVALLGRRVGGERVGCAAAVICTFYPAFIAADGALMSESLYGLVVALSLLQAIRLHQRPSLAGTVGLGIVIGIATLTRAEGWLLLPLLLVPLAVRTPQRRLAILGLGLVGSILVVGPWIVRNVDVFGRPALANDQGTAVAGSNCHETYYGHNIGWFSFPCTLGRNGTRRFRFGNEAVVSSRLTSAGLRYAGDHASRLPLVVGVRLARVWGFFQPGRQAAAAGRTVALQKAGVVIYYLLLVLAVVGFRALRARHAVLLVLGAPFVVTCIAAATTWGVVRLRASAEISLVVMAATGAVKALSWIQTRRSAERSYHRARITA